MIYSNYNYFWIPKCFPLLLKEVLKICLMKNIILLECYKTRTVEYNNNNLIITCKIKLIIHMLLIYQTKLNYYLEIRISIIERQMRHITLHIFKCFSYIKLSTFIWNFWEKNAKTYLRYITYIAPCVNFETSSFFNNEIEK